MKDVYGTGLKEYPSSGHINDVFIITPNQIEIFVETIWTSTKSNFQRDLNILHRSTASVKIIIVNPNILENDSFRRDFEKTRISERQRGIAISDMIDGSRILNDSEFVNIRFVEIVEELVNDVQMKKDSLISPEYISKLEITDLKMNVVNGDLRVNFELWNTGKVIVKLSSIEGIAIDMKGNEISPRAREPGDLIAIGTRKPVSLNFKHYNKKYEEIIIIKKHNDQIEQENFQISTYLKENERARLQLDPQFTHVVAFLFYPRKVHYDKRDPKKNKPRDKLVLVTDLKKAYWVGDYAWNLILSGRIEWFSEDEVNLVEWCKNKGYTLIENGATENNLLEPYFEAKIVDKKPKYKREEIIRFETHYRGNLIEGFFDNEILTPPRTVFTNGISRTWSWVPDTFSEDKGKLNGYNNYHSIWHWNIPEDAPRGGYEVRMRVYNLKDRMCIEEKIDTFSVY